MTTTTETQEKVAQSAKKPTAIPEYFELVADTIMLNGKPATLKGRNPFLMRVGTDGRIYFTNTSHPAYLKHREEKDGKRLEQEKAKKEAKERKAEKRIEREARKAEKNLEKAMNLAKKELEIKNEIQRIQEQKTEKQTKKEIRLKEKLEKIQKRIL